MEGRFQPSGDGFYPGRQYYAGDRSRSYNTNPGDASYYYSPLKRKRSITPPPKPQLVTRGFDSILHTFMARTERVGKDDRTSISNLTAPNLNVPALNTPNLNVPTLNAPNLNLPALNASNLNLPALNTPNLNRPVFNAPILNGPAISRPSKRTQASQQQEIRIPALSKKPAASCGRRAPPKAHGESGLMHFLPENIATDDELLQQKVTELFGERFLVGTEMTGTGVGYAPEEARAVLVKKRSESGAVRLINAGDCIETGLYMGRGYYILEIPDGDPCMVLGNPLYRPILPIR